MANPGEMHDGAPAGVQCREWRMLYFEASFVAELLAPEGVRDAEVVRPAVHDPGTSALLGGIFEAIIQRQSDQLLMEERLLPLLMRVLRRHGARRPPMNRFSPPVTRAVACVDSDPAAPVSLAQLAALSGVSRFQLIRGFVREVGITPHAYVVQRRVSLARRLLKEGRSLTEAALDAGFADQSHLTRVFLGHMGITPGRYASAVLGHSRSRNSVQDTAQTVP